MKHSFLSIVAMFINLNVFSQKNSTAVGKKIKFSITTYGGAATPLEKFTEFQTINPDEQSEIIGYNNFSITGAAGLGYSAGIDLIYAFGSRFNLGINTEYSNFSTEAVGYPEMYMCQNVIYGNEILYESKKWSAINILILPKYVFPLTKPDYLYICLIS